MSVTEEHGTVRLDKVQEAAALYVSGAAPNLLAATAAARAALTGGAALQVLETLRRIAPVLAPVPPAVAAP